MAFYPLTRFLLLAVPPTPQVISAAFGFSAVMYMLVISVGFLTFGGHASGLILNNYSSKDVLATIARIAVGAGKQCVL